VRIDRDVTPIAAIPKQRFADEEGCDPVAQPDLKRRYGTFAPHPVT
jgi:hypothetical protein